MLETHDFLQADDVAKIEKVADAVNSGNHTDNEIEKFIGVNSSGRQGRYYRLAAEKIGLVSLIDINHTVMTDEGKFFCQLNFNDRKVFLTHKIMALPIFSAAMIYIKTQKPDRQQLLDWFKSCYPGEVSTAERRFSTFINYLQFCKAI